MLAADVADAVTKRLVGTDSSVSLSSRMRKQRWERFRAEFPDVATMRLLDIGGLAAFWRHVAIRPAHVTLVNTREQTVEEPWMTAIVADACDLPDGLPEFDLVFSNSVIEHVGGHWRRQRFAEQIRTLGCDYWVQTPNRYFPVEPHFVFPFFQHLPSRARAGVATRWPIGNYGKLKDPVIALEKALAIELISAAEMRHYFPDAELLTERFAGLTKSLIAVRRSTAAAGRTGRFRSTREEERPD